MSVHVEGFRLVDLSLNYSHLGAARYSIRVTAWRHHAADSARIWTQESPSV